MAGMVDGKSVLITGAGGGIGRAAALAFAREGARVAVADLMEEAARETVALVNAAGGQALSLGGDVTQDADVRSMVEAVIGAYGRLDCAFNNAGIAGWQVDAAGKKTAEWSEEAFDRMIAVNLKGVWLCMRHELLQMQAQGWRRHRQYRVDRWARWPADLFGLCCGQARCHWADEDCRARIC